ncbi:hypothetical protein PMAYCL1PPCAC_13742, partial [Pristionchus mayeri]
SFEILHTCLSNVQHSSQSQMNSPFSEDVRFRFQKRLSVLYEHLMHRQCLHFLQGSFSPFVKHLSLAHSDGWPYGGVP